MSVYREVEEGLASFIEALIHVAQRQRLDGKKEFKTPRSTMVGRVLKDVQEADFKKLGLLKHGDMVLVDRSLISPCLKVMVIADDGRRAARMITDKELEYGDKSPAYLIARAIRSADAELAMSTSERACPEAHLHTKCPEGYAAWHEWTGRMGKTHKQIKCTGCGLYKIWVKKEDC